MQVDCFKENSLTFKISNTDGDNAVDVFNAVLKKCKREAGKRGFNNMFNADERAFIKEFTETIMNDEIKC